MDILNELLELEFLSKRYGDMLKTSICIIEKQKTLTDRQRYLMETAFYETMSSRLSSWLEVRSSSDFTLEIKSEYSSFIASEIIFSCRCLLSHLYLHLFPNAQNLSQVKIYHMLCFNCYKFMAQVTTDSLKQKQLVKQSLTAYSFFSSIDYFEKFAN